MASLLSQRGVSATSNDRTLNEIMLRELDQVIRWDPMHARAHLRLAAKHIAEFELLQKNAENSLGLAQVRDAVIASDFASREELQAWLKRAFGNNVQSLWRAATEARAAAALSPLQGEAYVYLAQLSFLETNRAPAFAVTLVDQALLARPYDADVLFEVGRQDLLVGNLDLALNRWTRCFQDSGPHQQKIVYLLAGRIPAELFLAEFKPDWRTLKDIWTRYRLNGRDEDLKVLAKYAAAAAEKEIKAHVAAPATAQICFWQSQFYADLDAHTESLDYLERAYSHDQNNYSIRRTLARALIPVGRYAEAESHLRWCLARRPDDRTLTSSLRTVTKHRLAHRGVAKPRQNSSSYGVGPLRPRSASFSNSQTLSP
jgi:tetratricopeptide (TPR) repeat protein